MLFHERFLAASGVLMWWLRYFEAYKNRCSTSFLSEKNFLWDKDGHWIFVRWLTMDTFHTHVIRIILQSSYFQLFDNKIRQKSSSFVCVLCMSKSALVEALVIWKAWHCIIPIIPIFIIVSLSRLYQKHKCNL